jgi:hypothetical protein
LGVLWTVVTLITVVRELRLPPEQQLFCRSGRPLPGSSSADVHPSIDDDLSAGEDFLRGARAGGDDVDRSCSDPARPM